jgi:hypothetical protein
MSILTDDDISFLVKDIKANNDKYNPLLSSTPPAPVIYKINNFIFEDVLRIDFKLVRLENRIKLMTTITSYYDSMREDEEYYEWYDTMLLVKDFDISDGKDKDLVIKNIVLLISSFRTNYRYSKILDSIDENSISLKKERRHIILHKLCKEKDIDTCCVCYDPNTVTTDCNHNVCRKCHAKIKFIIDEETDTEMKSCPMCRQQI